MFLQEITSWIHAHLEDSSVPQIKKTVKLLSPLPLMVANILRSGLRNTETALHLDLLVYELICTNNLL